MNNILEKLNGFTESKSMPEVKSRLQEIMLELDLPLWIFGISVQSSMTIVPAQVIHTWPEEWWAFYCSQGFTSVDPLVKHCLNKVTPLFWTPQDDWSSHGQDSVDFMNGVAEFGFTGGVVVPVHSSINIKGLFNIASKDPMPDVRERLEIALPILVLAKDYLYEAMKGLAIFQDLDLGLEKKFLSNREGECLTWVAEGKTSTETATILGISERSVVFHIQNAQKKLKVCNRQQAISKAVSLGLIAPEPAALIVQRVGEKTDGEN